MSVQTLQTQAGRLNKFKGEILKHSVPDEILSKAGRQVKFNANNSDTYVARRFLPYGATAALPNQFFAAGTGDRGNAMVQAHQTQEGVTSIPDSITSQDVTTIMVQYDCLYGFTDKTFDLHEDDIPAEMKSQVGERVTLVNEMVIFGQLKTCTNQYYGGAGTSRATVAGEITMNMIRKIIRNLMANYAKPVNKMLAASAQIATSPVSGGYVVYGHTDLESDIRNMANFIPVEKYGTGAGQAMPGEIGACEKVRFILSANFIPMQDAGAAVGATGLVSTTGANVDVYQFIVTGQDAWSQIAVRGKDILDPTFILPSEKSKSDPHGQRGYAGAKWYKGVSVENNGWMAVGNVGAKTL